MAIDFSGGIGSGGQGVSLAYLVYGVYHDEVGIERAVYWCGPKNRVGSGIVAAIPHTPTKRDGGPPVIWESRLSRCSLDADLGPLDQNIQTVTDLNFNVDISGGPNAPVPESGDLLRDIVYGRWENKKVYAWLYDLRTGDTQMIARGFFDRDPTSINANVFQVTVGVQPFLPTTEWPSIQMPSNPQDVWIPPSPETGSNPYPNDNYKANVTVTNPDLAGKYLGPIFGSSPSAQAASAPALEYHAAQAGNNWNWREVIPYGWNNATSTSRYIFALAAIEPGAYVHDVVYQMPGAETELVQSIAAYDTFYQTDAANGPVGTIVRFLIGLTTNPETGGSTFIFHMGPKNRVFARVSGRRMGRIAPTFVDTGVQEVTLDTGQGTRSTPWDILEDLVSEPFYLRDTLDALEPGLSARVWGTNALNDFQASVPSPGPHSNWIETCCAVPLNPTDRPMTLREGLGTLGAAFLFDIVERHDPVVDEVRLYPVWRTSFSDAPLRVFEAQDMSKTDPPSVTQLNNPDGYYANSIVVKTADRYNQPRRVDVREVENAGEWLIDPIPDTTFTWNDLGEQIPEKQGAQVFYELNVDRWHHEGDRGDASAAWHAGSEMSQPQRVVQATHGIRSYDLPMGSPIQYDIVGVNSDVGMVRKMRFDYDLQTVQVTSYHVDHFTQRGPPPEFDPDYEGDTPREHESNEPD